MTPMQEKIIDFLKRKQGYVSGEEIAERLKISRQGLWKHIQELKDSGYEISAVPHLGYKLDSSPDRLFAFEVTSDLNTKTIGRKILYFDALGSTMDEAMKQGFGGAASGTLIIAEQQAKGRGRLGRAWASPKYKGIYASLILRPKLPPAQASVLTLLAAVSIVEAVKEACGQELQIKWPNDILCSGEKLGGILTELVASMDEINFVVIGFGINVNNDAKSLVSGATSLYRQQKQNTSRVALLQEILRKVEKNYLALEAKGPEAIIQKWRGHNITLGKRVKVYCQHKAIEGQALDIDADGGLLVRKDSGISEKIMAGDVTHCR
ncbi:MAG: biotin--[acetyl-CoA-carboxylase] ligase [Candidatus Omnitrophota bacterium]